MIGVIVPKIPDTGEKMIAQPSSTASDAGNAADIDHRLESLRAELDDALLRIGRLEGSADNSARQASELFAQDSPAMKFAMKLCEEIFPGEIDVEVCSAPDEPDAKWYTLTVRASGTAKEVVDNQLHWSNQLDERYPLEAPEIRLSVKSA